MKENNNVILISCDSLYYKDWGIALLTSMQVHIPWINLHCHIVNPDKHYQKIAGVTYTTEERTFVNEESKISYLQAARFLAVQKYCNADDFVMTIDCDYICVTPFEEKLMSSKFMCPYDGFSFPEIEPRLFSFNSPHLLLSTKVPFTISPERFNCPCSTINCFSS